MALTPDNFKRLLMKAIMAYFDQMQKDVEVRIAILLKLEDSGLSDGANIMIAQDCSQRLVDFLRVTVVESRELERTVDKLI